MTRACCSHKSLALPLCWSLPSLVLTAGSSETSIEDKSLNFFSNAVSNWVKSWSNLVYLEEFTFDIYQLRSFTHTSPCLKSFDHQSLRIYSTIKYFLAHQIFLCWTVKIFFSPPTDGSNTFSRQAIRDLISLRAHHYPLTPVRWPGSCIGWWADTGGTWGPPARNCDQVKLELCRVGVSEHPGWFIRPFFHLKKRRQGQSQSGDRDSGRGGEKWLLHRTEVSDKNWSETHTDHAIRKSMYPFCVRNSFQLPKYPCRDSQLWI